MTDGIGKTNVGQKLIAQSFAFAGAFDQPSDIGKLKSRIYGLLRVKQLCQPVDPGIRHFHHADIGLNGRKRIIGSFHLTLGDRIEQRGLSYIRQAHDSRS